MSEDINFVYATKHRVKSYDALYSMFATDFELNSLAQRIYASKNAHSHKISLIKKCKEAC